MAVPETETPEPAVPDTAVPEIVGIGAVNLDYIINSVAGSIVDSELLSGFDYGSERAATAAEIEETLRRLHALKPVAGPGGSALNTMATIAAADIPVTLGYVGVRGSTSATTSALNEFSFPEWFASLGIDDRFVAEVDESVGICISYTDGGERSMLTTDGANRFIIDHVEQHTDALVDHLRRTKVILVTSFANLTDISPLVDLLATVKAQAPRIQICCDPGAMWTIETAPVGVDRLLALSEWLLLNRQEFDRYTDRSPGEDVLNAARRALIAKAETTGRPPSILLKAPDRIDVFTNSGSETAHHVHDNSQVLNASDIVDDTGAGDAFAAGFLTSFIRSGLDPSAGIELGMALAREKLLWGGLSGSHRYGPLYRDFCRTHEIDLC